MPLTGRRGGGEAEGRFDFVEFEQLLLGTFGVAFGHVDGLLLPLHGFVEVAHFRISGGQGFNIGDRLPLAQLTCFGSRFDRPFAIANFRIGAGRQQPGFVLIGQRVFGR